MKGRKTVSAAKIAANQENAQKSTGPTSEIGRSMSRRNAIRHGILAHDLVLPCESQTELEELRREMTESYDPVGWREILQVEIIVMSTWRLRRLLRAEVGEVAMTLADREPAAQIAAATHTRQYQQARTDRSKLGNIEEEIKRKGCVSAETLEWVRGLPYGEAVSIFVTSVELVQTMAGRKRGGPDKKAATEKERQSTPSGTGSSENTSRDAGVSSGENEEQCASLECEGSENASPNGVASSAENEGQSSSRDAENPENAGPCIEDPPAEGQDPSAAPDQIGEKEKGNRYVPRFLLSSLDILSEAIEAAAVRHGQRVVSKVTAQGNALLVPHDSVLNRFTRYENHLTRNLYRAEHELERAQRLRLGDEVPPPSARID